MPLTVMVQRTAVGDTLHGHFSLGFRGLFVCLFV